MYDLYLGSMLVPVTPESITTQINGRNETLDLINDGQINVLKLPGLTTASFSVLLPSTLYPFARYMGGFQAPQYYLNQLESMKANKQPFQWIVSRRYPSGKTLHNTNITMVLEDYAIREDAKNNGFDLMVDIHLKQFKSAGTKVFSVDLPSATAPIVIPETRPPSTTPPKNPSKPTTSSGPSKTSTSSIFDKIKAGIEKAKTVVTSAVGAVAGALATLGTNKSVSQTVKKIVDSSTTKPTQLVSKDLSNNKSKVMVSLR